MNSLLNKQVKHNSQSQIEQKRITSVLDFFALFAVFQYVTYRFLQSTTFLFVFSNQYKVFTFLLLLFAGGTRFITLAFRRYKSKEDKRERVRSVILLLVIVCLAIPFLYVGYLHDYKVLVFIPLTALCFYQMKPEQIFRGFSCTISILLLATVICSLSGAIRNINAVDVEEGVFKGSYGIINTTDFAAYFLVILLFSWCGFNNDSWNNRLLFFFLSVAFAIVTDFLSGSHTTFICCIFTGVAILWEWLEKKYHNRVKLLSKTIDVLIVAAFPAIAVLFAVITYLYGQGNELATKINTILSHRIQDTYQIVLDHGIHLFGTSFVMHGNGGSVIHDWRGYDFLDSSYAYVLVRYGIIIFIIVCLLWIWMTIMAIRKGKKRMALSMAIIAFYAFSESHFLEINFNIFFAIPLCLLSNNPEKEGESDEMLKNRKAKWFPLFSFSSILLICYLISPRILSWFRTLVFLKSWNYGMMTGWMLALSVSFILILLLGWKGLVLLWNKQKRTGITSCIISVLLLFIGVYLINAEIQQGLINHSEELTAEQKQIELIVENAKQKVFASEKSELYQRYYSGLSDHTMTVDDICREKKGTMITDKSIEGMTIIQQGGKYLQISDTSGVYTFDQSVIDAFEKNGYGWKDYYYSERVCHLDDLALLNQLQLDNKGRLILEGENHSLSKNRFIEGFAGRYEVDFSLFMNVEDLQRLQRDDIVCHLQLMGYNGEKVLLDWKVPVSLFDENGCCIIEMPYAIYDIPRIEFWILAEDDITLYVDRIAWREVSLL